MQYITFGKTKPVIYRFSKLPSTIRPVWHFDPYRGRNWRLATKEGEHIREVGDREYPVVTFLNPESAQKLADKINRRIRKEYPEG